MILYLLCHRCTIFFNYHFCMRAHRGWDWGGRSWEVSRELLSDPMGRCEVSSVPASTRPLLTSICRGTCPTTGFVWGVGVMTERSHTHSAPPLQKWRTTDISVMRWNIFYLLARSRKTLVSTVDNIPVEGDSMLLHQHGHSEKEFFTISKVKCILRLCSLKQ